MPVGFGSSRPGYGPAGVDVQPIYGSREDQFTDDIHAIRVKYVDGRSNSRYPLQYANAYDTVRIDATGQRINCVILTVTVGIVYGYLFDQTARLQAPQFPDFVVSAAVVPSTLQIMIPEGQDYVIVLQEASGATTTVGVARICKL